MGDTIKILLKTVRDPDTPISVRNYILDILDNPLNVKVSIELDNILKEEMV